MLKTPKRIIITTGDTNGIGLEVTLKALVDIKIPAGYNLDVFYEKPHASFLKMLLTRIAKKKNIILSEHRKNNPVEWVLSAGDACLNNEAVALVTAPLSKELIQATGYKEVGHTEILKAQAGVENVFMAFLGQHFHVLLATGHVAIRDIAKHLTAKQLSHAFDAALRLRKLLPPKSARKPIGVVGLNPHAGEKSIIGAEEATTYKKVLAAYKTRDFTAPLVPDVCFQKQYWPQYSLYVTPYHDQGLIPFKMVHGQDSGVHLSVGLPYIRTSVDHGTAKDIFGKNKANPASMRLAIEWAIKLSKEAKNGI